jgi:hypothetical protein
MSWLYLPELVEDCSQADCLAGEPSVQSKSTSIVSESYSKDNGTDTSKSSPSGTTCEPSTESRGVVESMSLPAVFLASLSASPASGQGRTMNATAGRTRHEYLTKYDRSTRCWRTCQACLFQDTLEEFAGTWPRSGFVFDGVCYLLPEVEHRTLDNGSGLLPTPVAYDATPGGPNNHYKGLGHRAKWPTPRYSDYKGAVTNTETTRRRQESGQANLCEVIVNNTLGGGRLNPNWVEWLMGWPIGWTALEPLATDKFQQWLSAHGMNSQD